MPDEDGYWQSAEPGPAPMPADRAEDFYDLIPLGMVEKDPLPPKGQAQGLFQQIGVPWRWKRPRLVCTCSYYFGPGMDMIRTADPDCPWVEHRRLAQQREEGP